MLQSIAKPEVRWLIRRDMPFILDIENQNNNPWNESDFIYHLRQRNVIGTVLEIDHEIYGFILYELHKHSLNILKVSVKKKHMGYGMILIQRLKDKLSQQRRTKISVVVDDDNLGGQLFFQKMGFLATGVAGEEYLFEYYLE